MLRNINSQVVQDFEDRILINGFPRDQRKADVLEKKIKAQQKEDREFELQTNPIYKPQLQKEMTMKKEDDSKEEAKKIKDPVQRGEEEDRKRQYLNEFRPCGLDDRRHEKPMQIWHFIEEEQKTPHVLRPLADPFKSYSDGRCEKLMALIEQLAGQIKTHNKETWDKLNMYTW